MTDDRFEQRLRGFLAAREPASASPVLRARLQSVTAESPVRSGGWIGRLGGAWRAAVGVAAVTALAVALLAVLLRVDAISVRDPSPIGGAPSAVPGAVTVPFVTAPGDLFTQGAVANAERRLAAVYAATRVEATLVVQAEADAQSLSTPVGWPDGFDRDGNGDRDITAVIGIAPDGTPVCCLTITGSLIAEAREDGYWRPLDQPGALDSDLAADTVEFRDVALDRFVRGIEDLAPGIAIVEAEALDRGDFARALGLIAVLGPLVLLAFVAARRRAAISPDRSGGVAEMLEVAPAVPTTSVAAPKPAAAGSSTVSWVPPAPSPWPILPDRILVLVSFAAIAGLALLGVVDLLRPAATDVPLDTSLDGVGAARAGLSLVPIALLGIGLAAIIVYARQGRWRRRIGILALVVAVGWTMSAVIDHTRPTTPNQDRSWVTGDPDVEISRNAVGLGEYLTHNLAPGEAFTYATLIQNPGVLPLTVLGLDGVRTTQPNPYVASIVSLGWVVQPTGAGPITTLSAKPEDASASWPVTLRGGEALAIVIVGRAGPCAEASGTVTDLPLGHVDLRYRVLGFERSTEVGLPSVMSFASKDPCTVEIPGGTMTYSTPE